MQSTHRVRRRRAPHAKCRGRCIALQHTHGPIQMRLPIDGGDRRCVRNDFSRHWRLAGSWRCGRGAGSWLCCIFGAGLCVCFLAHSSVVYIYILQVRYTRRFFLLFLLVWFISGNVWCAALPPHAAPLGGGCAPNPSLHSNRRRVTWRSSHRRCCARVHIRVFDGRGRGRGRCKRMLFRTFSSKTCLGINPELMLTAKIFIGGTWVMLIGGIACTGCCIFLPAGNTTLIRRAPPFAALSVPLLAYKKYPYLH